MAAFSAWQSPPLVNIPILFMSHVLLSFLFMCLAFAFHTFLFKILPFLKVFCNLSVKKLYQALAKNVRIL